MLDIRPQSRFWAPVLHINTRFPATLAHHGDADRNLNMTSAATVVAGLAGLLLAFSALAGNAGCDDLRGEALYLDVDWQTEIKPILNTMLGGRCTGCHFPGTFPDLTDVGGDAIYKIIGSYVIPGEPLSSGLFDKVNCDQPLVGQRMPLAGAPLELMEQALIYDWIAQGALGEPDTPIFRDYLFRDGAESRRWY